MKTYLDWSEYEDAGMGDAYADIPKTGGDFAKAVAVCINSRQCETNAKGVMCPSFRLKASPHLSTGGRVRLLKAALNGTLEPNGLLNPELVEAMDLCVSCKGCKRECENNVDMARIKIEYQAQLNDRMGLSLRARLFSELPHLLSRSPWFARLVGWRNRSRRLSRLGERFLGISAQVSLPVPIRDPAPFSRHTQSRERSVVLFVDTFNRHYAPEVVQAAIDVLEAAGNRVILSTDLEEGEALSSGRTYLAQGRVDKAREEAHRVVEALLPMAREGVPIIGLEPSCLLTLRDEYSALGLGADGIHLAKQALLFEEYLARELTSGRLSLPWRSAGAGEAATRLLVHGHCHQKAVGAMKSMRKVLKAIPGLDFKIIDASCCGMAGSFGVEAEHMQAGREMAEQALAPALRQEPEALVVANGFSCRHQIDLTTGRTGLHLAELIRARLSLAG
ncbi:MAG: heterodisulfide reductase-related iron-sulfur binding cluster [Candidatus Thiodiazotropha sp.]